MANWPTKPSRRNAISYSTFISLISIANICSVTSVMSVELESETVSAAVDVVNVEESEIVHISDVDEPQKNLWAHLDNFLIFKKTEGNIVIFDCKICLPKRHEVRCHRTSNYNIKSHFKHKHQTMVTKIEEALKVSSSRGKKRQVSGVIIASTSSSDAYDGDALSFSSKMTKPRQMSNWCCTIQ